MALRAVALIALGLLGCDGPAASPAPVEPPRPVAPEPAPEASPPPLEEEPAEEEAEGPPGPCELEAPTVWLEDVGDRITLAARPDLVVAMDDAGFATSRALDGGGAQGEAEAFRVEGGRALLGLEPAGEGALLLALGSCAGEAHCLIARRVRPLDPSESRRIAPLPGPLRTQRRTATSRRVYFAWTAEGGHAGLEIFTLDGDGLGRVRTPLGDARASDDHPAELLGLAAAGDSWAALWRRGALESADSEVFLTTDVGHRHVEALHDALALDAMARDNREVALVATFEFSRPHFLRLDPRRDEPLAARELGPDDTVPAPLTDHERAFLDVDQEGVWLHRQSAAGDPLHAPTRVTEARGVATLTRLVDARYAVAWHEGGDVRARVVDCVNAPRR